VFDKLKIPKSLEKSLPFSAKQNKQKKEPTDIGTLLSRRAVILEPHEKKVHDLMKQIALVKQEKLKKKKRQQKENLKKIAQARQQEEETHLEKSKESRKKIHKLEGIFLQRSKKART
jgi:ribosome biogenesis protein BMS1